MLSYSVLSTEFIDRWKDEFRLAAALVAARFPYPGCVAAPPTFDIDIEVGGFDIVVTEQLDYLASLFVEVVIYTLVFLASGGS